MKNCIQLKVLLMGLLLSFILVGCNAKASSTPIEVVPEGPATVEAYGTVQIRDKENMTLEVPGKITKVNVLNGQYVQKGDVLFTMNIKEYLDDLTQKHLELTIKEQELKLIDVDTSLEQQIAAKELELSNRYTRYDQLDKALIGESDEDLKAAKLNEDFAKKQYLEEQKALTNSEALFKEGIISQSELNSATTKLENAKLTYETSVLSKEKILQSLDVEKSSVLEQIKNMESQIDQLEGENGQSAVQYEIKQMEIKMLEQEIQRLESKLNNDFFNDKGEVICQMDGGIFDAFNYAEGDIITTNSNTPAYTLYNSNSLEIYAKVSEDFINKVYVGQKVNIIPVASREHVLIGEVTDIATLAYQEGGEAVIPVRIKFEDDIKLLKMNFSVDVAFVLEEQ